MYNSVDDDFDSTYQTNLVVYNDGSVVWIPPGIFKFSCKIDITWFPFDDQLCFAKFGSWSFDMTKIDLQPDKAGGFDWSDYMVNGEWAVTKSETNLSLKYYDCCPDNPYPSLMFYFYLRRRPLFYAFNLIFPCLCITVVAIFGYILPSESSEMIGLQVTIMLAICMFLNIVSTMSPPTSEAVPLLGIYFSLCSVIICASVVLTVLIINLHRRSPDFQLMGYTGRAIYLQWIPWMTRLRRPGHKMPTWSTLPNPFKNPAKTSGTDSLSGTTSSSKEKLVSKIWKKPKSNTIDACVGTEDESRASSSTSLKTDANGNVKTIWTDLLVVANKIAEEQDQEKMHTIMEAHKGNVCPAEEAVILSLMRVFEKCKMITKRNADADEASEAEADWIFAGMAIEKLCLLSLPVILSISTIYVFANAPYLDA